MDSLPPNGRDLLEGKPFRDRSIIGAVESDFFDWILVDPLGATLVTNNCLRQYSDKASPVANSSK